MLDETDVQSILHGTVRQILKNELQPHRSSRWAIPPGQNAKFVCRMEDVLALYHEPYDKDRPVVCFDVSNKQLLNHVRDSLPAKPGAVARTDYTYRRAGTCNLFLISEPLVGWRHVDVTKKRTKVEFVEQMRQLVDEHYPNAICIRVVLDNFSTHTEYAFYEFLPSTEDRRLLHKLEFHFISPHGIWLNMAKIELSTLASQCLDRRIPDVATLRSEVAAWEQCRNNSNSFINWQFTTDDARIKLAGSTPSQLTLEVTLDSAD